MTDEIVKKIKEVIKETPGVRLMSDEEMKDLAEHAKDVVKVMKEEHINNTPAFSVNEFQNLHKAWDARDKDDESEKASLLKQFGEFPLESHEIITLKEGIKFSDWAEYVNLNKGDPYSYAVISATVRMAGYLAHTDLTPQKAWDRTAQIEDLTGFMMGALISSIAKFIPRGDEVRKAWNKHHNVESKGTVNPALWTIGE